MHLFIGKSFSILIISFDFLNATSMDFSSRKATTKHVSRGTINPIKSVESSTYVSRPGVSALYYCDEMDFLISGYEDARVCNAS
jgi:hypothetical protein